MIYDASFSPLPIKRRIFVSYHHGGDQAYYDAFCRAANAVYEVITDRSLDRARNSEDPEYIMRYIRERHITGSSTIIVLCGAHTRYRKYVDWEIHAALRQQTALIGVKLPTVQVVDNSCSKPDRLQDNINTGYAKWVWWEDLFAHPEDLRHVIEDANSRSKSLIDNRRARRVRNG